MPKAATAQKLTPNAFVNRPNPPTDNELAAALGSAQALWDQLLARLANDCGVALPEWSSYSRKAGWSLKVKRGERNIVYVSPCQCCFRASFALGDKSILAAHRNAVPPQVLRAMQEGRKYAEGTAVRVEVHTEADVDTVVQLAILKLKN